MITRRVKLGLATMTTVGLADMLQFRVGHPTEAYALARFSFLTTRLAPLEWLADEALRSSANARRIAAHQTWNRDPDADAHWRLLANLAAQGIEVDEGIIKEARSVLAKDVESRDRNKRQRAILALLHNANVPISPSDPDYEALVLNNGALLRRTLSFDTVVEEGLWLLSPESPNAPDVDVVLIHGVSGDPLTTWVKEDDEAVVWPREWLARDVPNARILSVGFELYLSEWNGSALSLEQQAQHIVRLLRMADADGSERPVVIVTHSFGGLLAKQMIADGVFERPGSIVFFGTPHRGTDLVALMEPFPWLTRHTAAVPALLPDSIALDGLHKRFMNRVRKDGWTTHSFGEGVSCNVEPTGLKCVQVVPDRSARLDPDEPFSKLSHANHRTICKPSDANDERYTVVLEKTLAALKRNDGANVD